MAEVQQSAQRKGEIASQSGRQPETCLSDVHKVGLNWDVSLLDRIFNWVWLKKQEMGLRHVLVVASIFQGAMLVQLEPTCGRHVLSFVLLAQVDVQRRRQPQISGRLFFSGLWDRCGMLVLFTNVGHDPVVLLGG